MPRTEASMDNNGPEDNQGGRGASAFMFRGLALSEHAMGRKNTNGGEAPS